VILHAPGRGKRFFTAVKMLKCPPTAASTHSISFHHRTCRWTKSVVTDARAVIYVHASVHLTLLSKISIILAHM